MASLAKYQQKRDFSKTKEPAGVVERPATRGPVPRKPPRFLIQKHDASRLHYDVRFEIDGVLKSWACPKGPSLDPADKRLAVEVEDHPLAYGTFEGTIPEGQYGGGTVLLWDHGTFEIKDGKDALAEWKAGRLHVVLHGEKLKGAFRLVRMPKRGNEKQVSWLLIKSNDEFAVAGGGVDALDDKSVKTGRSLREIADASDAVWQSNRVEPTKRPTKQKKPEKKPEEKPAKTTATKTAKKTAKKTATKPAKVEIEGVVITHPERRVFGDDSPITKRDVARYVVAVAPLLLPHVEGRPLSVVRCTSGIGGPSFFQKHIGKGMPEAIHALELAGDDEQWLMVDDAAGLAGLVQMGVLEIHAWGCRPWAPEQPDRIVMDIDPGDDLAWPRVADAARAVRQKLEERGLTTFLKSTGGKGLHVCAPLDGAASWDEVKAFCKAIADDMEREAPDLYTSNMRKALRRGRVFVDYLRNGRGSTAIAPWCVRARPGAPVSVPLAWSEVDVVPRWTLLNLHERMTRRDPWETWFDVRQRLPRPAPRRRPAARAP